MTIEEIAKDFIDTSRERLKTPISGAFLWSFIIYNWRPIFLLLFSNASIENKIIVINHEYCNFWAILLPIFIALFYTILIPKLMLSIDKALFETKKERVDTKYDATEHFKDRHIDIAKKDFLLKSVESGSKEKQDFLDEIESLKETIQQKDESQNQIITSNKNAIEQLNESLKLSNTLLEEKEKEKNLIKQSLEKDLKEARRSTYFAKDVSNTLRKLNKEFASKFMDLKEEEGGKLVFRLTSNRQISLQKFWELKLVEQIDENHYIFTDLGSTIYNMLNLNSQLNNPYEIVEVLGKHVREAYKSLSTVQRSRFHGMISGGKTVDTSKVSVNEVNEFTDLNLITGSLDTREFVLTELGKGVLQFIVYNI